jgi:hypothetical protein
MSPPDVYRNFAEGRNLFTTTIYVLISAVITIARETRIPSGVKLYRGLGGDRNFPPCFYKCDAKGRKGIVEWGLMSTTANKAMAIQYSGIKQGKPFPTIFEIVSGTVDRGADISAFSQYPGKHF